MQTTLSRNEKNVPKLKIALKSQNVKELLENYETTHKD